MKRTCNGCKAFFDNDCLLGYRIAASNSGLLSFDFKPCEECPKPLTNIQYIAERNKHSYS